MPRGSANGTFSHASEQRDSYIRYYTKKNHTAGRGHGAGSMCGGFVCDFGLADLPLTSVTLCPFPPFDHTPLDVHVQPRRHPSLRDLAQLNECSISKITHTHGAMLGRSVQCFFWETEVKLGCERFQLLNILG